MKQGVALPEGAKKKRGRREEGKKDESHRESSRLTDSHSEPRSRGVMLRLLSGG